MILDENPTFDAGLVAGDCRNRRKSTKLPFGYSNLRCSIPSSSDRATAKHHHRHDKEEEAGLSMPGFHRGVAGGGRNRRRKNRAEEEENVGGEERERAG